MEKEKEDIYLRSEEFQEVLGWIPPWILRWGITVLACTILILLTGSMFFKYPDIISARMTLTSTTPSAAIVARSSGKIKELFIRDNENIKSDTYLAIIENPAETEDILTLKNYLSHLNPEEDKIFNLPPKELKLGLLQSQYTTFYLTLVEHNEFIQLNYYPEKVRMTEERINQYTNQYHSLTRQQSLVEEQLRINEKQFSRDSSLAVNGVLSAEELENSRNQLLQSKLSFENILSSMHSMLIQIEQLRETLFENNHQYIEKKNAYTSQLNTLCTQLKTSIHGWEIEFAIISPISGQITFTNYWAVNQNILAGEVVFNVVPEEEAPLIGKAYLPTSRSGKVKAGQKVNIRFDNFPDNEFGIVKGYVKNISLVPMTLDNTTVYMVEIDLPDGLHTNYKKELPYLPGMEAQADIITDDISAFQRIIMPVRKAVTEGFE